MIIDKLLALIFYIMLCLKNVCQFYHKTGITPIIKQNIYAFNVSKINDSILPTAGGKVKNSQNHSTMCDLRHSLFPPLRKKTFKLSINTQVEHYFDSINIVTISI